MEDRLVLPSAAGLNTQLGGSDLPPELVIHILEIAATSSCTAAHKLSQVSHWVREIALPCLWSTLVIRDPKGEQRNDEEDLGLMFCELEGDTIMTRPMPTPEELPPDVVQHLHSLFYVGDRKEAWFAQRITLSAVQKAARAIVWHALPHLQRVALSFNTAEHITKTASANIEQRSAFYDRHYPLKELFLVSGPLTSVPTLDFRCFSQLTHLRVTIALTEDLLDPRQAGKKSDHLRIVLQLPALTHYAFEHWRSLLISDKEPLESHMEEMHDEAIVGQVDELLDIHEPRLQFVLVLLRSWPGTEDQTAPVLAHLESRDPRVISMTTETHPARDWRLWEKLARDDRNIWDEALEQRRLGRRLDSLHTTC